MNRKRIVSSGAVAALLFLLASCGGGIRLSSIDKSYTTDTATVSAKIPQLSGIKSKSLQATLNKEYVDTISELLDNFTKTVKSTGEKSGFDVRTAVQYNKNGIYSVITQIDCLSAYSQQNSFRITNNIDTKNCTQLELSDLFTDASYIDVLNERITETTNGAPEKYADLWEKPRLGHNQQFYISGRNLVLVYPPYELSYYERGFVEIPIDLAEISGYLKPEYKKLSAE